MYVFLLKWKLIKYTQKGIVDEIFALMKDNYKMLRDFKEVSKLKEFHAFGGLVKIY